jgi:Tfp pilus assembly protein FimT
MTLRTAGRAGGIDFRSGSSGFSLAELSMGLGILAMAVSLALPPVLSWTKRQRLEGAIRFLAMDMAAARWNAIASGRSTGLAFRDGSTGELTWTTYRDGDGDGVRSADMIAGVDRPMGHTKALSVLAPGVQFGVLSGFTVPRLPPQRGALTNLSDPVKFGAADMAVFSPVGSATAGSLYLHNGEDMVALVLNGVTGRLRLFRLVRGPQQWKEMT